MHDVVTVVSMSHYLRECRERHEHREQYLCVQVGVVAVVGVRKKSNV